MHVIVERPEGGRLAENDYTLLPVAPSKSEPVEGEASGYPGLANEYLWVVGVAPGCSLAQRRLSARVLAKCYSTRQPR